MEEIKEKKSLWSDLSLFILFFIVGVIVYWMYSWAQKPPEFIIGNYSQYFVNKEEHVIAYTTEDCTYCILLKDYFKKNNIRYVELDIQKSPEASAQYKVLGEYGTPLIVFKDKIIVGFRPELITTELKRLDIVNDL